MNTVFRAAVALSISATIMIPASAANANPGKIDWTACPSDAAPTKECGYLRVPRQYDRPQGKTVRVALSRIPATGTAEQRIGSLLWDAGGPGGVSTEMIDRMSARMSSAVRKRFDFVAFDPRGIGASRPALQDCATPYPQRPALEPFPSWGNVRDASAADLAKANRQCLSSSRNIAPFMGTNNVVRDLDRIRAAVGDRKLTFWATSYGTRIGYVYALRYPQRVRAMIMDGSIDPSVGYAGLPTVGGTSADRGLRFIRHNAHPIYRSVIKTTASLTVEPVDLRNGTEFTRWDWLDTVSNIVPFQASWTYVPQIADIIDVARTDGPNSDKARSILTQLKEGENGNEGGGFSMVNCLDYSDRLSPARQASITAANAEAWPVMGGSLTLMFAIGCSGLGQLTPDPIPLVTTPAQRARLADVPVLLANATHDASTPIPWARQMQRVFQRPMIQYRSSQHVIWGAVKSKCVNQPLDRFVLEQRMPRKGRTCAFVPPEPTKTASLASLASLGR